MHPIISKCSALARLPAHQSIASLSKLSEVAPQFTISCHRTSSADNGKGRITSREEARTWNSLTASHSFSKISCWEISRTGNDGSGKASRDVGCTGNFVTAPYSSATVFRQLASTPFSGSAGIPHREGMSMTSTGKLPTAPYSSSRFQLDFQQLCSITLSPLPSGQFPFIMPSRLPISSPGIRRPGLGDNVMNKLPSIWNTEKCDPVPDAYREIDAPTAEHLKIEKHAARLVRIRHRKMKKHQYKKLQKRMGRRFAKDKLKRFNRALKLFYAAQNLIVTKAKAFDPEEYVRNYLATAKGCEEAREEELLRRRGPSKRSIERKFYQPFPKSNRYR
ncbi:hypothetical protein BV898_13402 [Hypsibius exemplaris]|uniref:Ribosomal protein mS38 C-terminal domain-containing protein n=1 Tax=Hypsibius exemplaris TaxID=2072580 RepID=A0A1W0WAU4_HYPEX|nr:hypothetical protein BV898_13402 [Hypsibius exemplaris]